MKGKPRINEVFVYVVVDDDGTEGVPAFQGSSGVYWPMVGADIGRSTALRKVAEQMATRLGKPLHLLRFTVREEVEVIQP